MSIDIRPQLSLLQTLLDPKRETEAANRPVGENSGAFTSALDRALESSGTPAAPQNPETIAEALRLQMLQTTLSLSDEHSHDSGTIGQPGFLLKELARTYSANTPPAAAVDASPRQPLDDTVQPTGGMQPRGSQSGEAWLEPIISRASQRYGVDVSLIKAVIQAESGFNPTAVSPAGARGLMQLMPATARGLGVSDSFDPEQNVMAGTRFLRDMLRRYNGDLDSALAAYNWGPGNVDRGTGRLPRETRDYLARVKQLYHNYAA